jgi:small-conductance mechanosensitive channel
MQSQNSFMALITSAQQASVEPLAFIQELLEPLLGAEQAEKYSLIAAQVWQWVLSTLLSWNMALQLGLLFGAIIPAIMFGPRLKRFIDAQIATRVPYGILKKTAKALAAVATPIALYLILCLFIGGLSAAGQDVSVIKLGRALLTAWILVRLVTLVIQSPFWSKVAFYTIWPIMALDAFGVLDSVMQQMEAASIQLSPGDPERGIPEGRLSLLDVIRAAIIFGIFFWVANTLSTFLNRRIQKVDELNPSLKAMFGKVINLVLPIVALLFALNAVGFNLTSLAIFGGAVGLGIGLGLQRVVSNFAAGVTLLMDKSIKPGDTIEVDNTFGWITAMNTRYVAVRTRDGTEHLLPNDIFMENGVVNWSHADRVVRVHVPFGISYAHRDVRYVQEKVEALCVTIDRVLALPKPRCNLVEFGDSSVNFDLRFWINDPANGVTNVKSDVMMAIWDWLHEEGIEIPFPQHDLHLKTSDIDFSGASLPKPQE